MQPNGAAATRKAQADRDAKAGGKGRNTAIAPAAPVVGAAGVSSSALLGHDELVAPLGPGWGDPCTADVGLSWRSVRESSR
jgi:hypothetical protein